MRFFNLVLFFITHYVVVLILLLLLVNDTDVFKTVVVSVGIINMRNPCYDLNCNLCFWIDCIQFRRDG
jgi:hypothetical protein